MKMSEYLAAARITAAEGRLEDALAFLENRCSLKGTIGWQGTTIETLVVKALITEGLGKTETALRLLNEAIAMAKLEGYTRVFLDEGAPMAFLLRKAAGGHGLSGYGKRLLKLFPDTGVKNDVEADNNCEQYIEALSSRELEILKLAAQGLSNKAIAGRLYLSLSTVKWHTGNIFGKLGAANRTEAAAKARDMGLIE